MHPASAKAADRPPFEELLLEIATTFINVSPSELNRRIEQALERCVRFLGVDRSTFAEFSGQPPRMVALASWAGPGFEPFRVGGITADLPWVCEQLLTGNILKLNTLPDDFPLGAKCEREEVRRTGIKSALMVPVRVGSRVLGGLSFGSFRTFRQWPERIVGRVQLLGEIFANAVAQTRAIAEVEVLKERLEAENLVLREEIQFLSGFEDMVGESRVWKRVLEHAHQVAVTDATVLLLGETGTGKELIAHAIHARSRRQERPFVTVNCAAIPSTLVESEFFGHERGAFTGALDKKVGRFELADGGTIFLDEIGDLAPELQAKLLRVLQQGEFERLGSIKTLKVDVRVIAATNRNLEQAMAIGVFRPDLYYRLKVFPLHLPPLRERVDDIPLLVWYFVTRRQAKLGRHIEQIPRATMDALTRYAWPGNVRELENVIERALILSPGSTLVIDESFVPGTLDAGGASIPVHAAETLAEVERAHILRVVDVCGGRITGKNNAAECLGINPSTLRSRMKKLGIRTTR